MFDASIMKALIKAYEDTTPEQIFNWDAIPRPETPRFRYEGSCLCWRCRFGRWLLRVK